MKHEILDDMFNDDFRNQLSPDEKIIWEGNPYFKLNIRALIGEWTYHTFLENIMGIFVLLFFLTIFLLPLIFFLMTHSLVTQIILIVIILIISGYRIFKIFQRKKTKYFITNKRIVFQLWKEMTTTVHFIPFSEINNLIVTEIAKNNGVIFLFVKNPQSIYFETYDLESGELRHQPTLEMIEDVEEVANCIRLGIQGEL